MSKQHGRKQSSGILSGAPAPFNLSPIAALVGSMTFMASVAWAQEAPKPNATAPASASAQDAQAEQKDEPQVQTLEGVTVRSRPRLAKLQDKPVAESVVTGAELARDGARDFNAITKRLPGITFNQSNTRGASLSIRGLGKRGFAEFQDPSVLASVDDVSFGLTQLGNFDFYDIDQVSVQRGPSGTGGGKGGSAGQIAFTSKQPTFVPQGEYSITYGARETLIANAAYGGPIVDDLLAWRGAVSINKARGYYQNGINDRGNITLYNTDRLAGRTQFLLTPTPNLKARLAVELEPRTNQVQNGLSEYVESPLRYGDGTLVDRNGTSARAILGGYTNRNGVSFGPREWFQGRGFTYADYLNSTTNNGTVNFNEAQGQNVGYRGSSLKVDYKLPSNDTISSITGWRAYTFDARNDEGTPYDINKYGGGGVYYQQLSQELRLQSETDKPFEYTAGLYFIGTQDQVESHAGYGSDAGAWYANAAQYALLQPASNGTAATANQRNAGRALLTDSLNNLYTRSDTNTNTKSLSVYGETKWKIDEKLALNTGLRLTRDRRDQLFTQSIPNGGAGSGLSYETQKSSATTTVPLGGFTTNATTGALTSTAANAKLAADAAAFKYFGVAAGANPGDAYNSLSDTQKKQIAYVQAIRSARLGATNFNGATSSSNGLLATTNVSPTYKFNEEVTGYFAWQYGEKAGTPNIANGVSLEVRPERTQAFELGFKSNLLDKTLVFNANLFLMNIRDYQQTVRVKDVYNTEANANGDGSDVYTNTQGNVPLVRSKGLELNAIYSGLKNTTLQGGFTYNDTHYVKFDKAGFPAEQNYLSFYKLPDGSLNPNYQQYYDQSGKPVAGAPRFNLTVGGEYRLPVWDNQSFHASFTTNFLSSYNNDESLSAYTLVPKHSVTDVTVGLGNVKKNFDVSLTVKNVFDDKTHEVGWTSYEPTPYRRWAGVTFSGQL